MNKLTKRLLRIIAACVILGAALIVKTEIEWLNLALYIAAYLTAGADVVLKAVRNIFHGRIFDENFLMALATVGAFFTSDYPEAVTVMVLYQIGELFQSYAVSRSRRSIAALMDIRPDHANLQTDTGIESVDPTEVKTGDIIVVKSGERVPLDGVVISGTSQVDTSALTGESVPRTLREGDEILSGSINMSGLLTVRVTGEYGDSTVSRILELVENASSRKAKTENFITKFAAIYTPIVVICAVILAFVPPLIMSESFNDWIYRALNFLVVSCPCALVISVPLSFFGGIGGASKAGILIKGSNYMELLAKAQTAVFDKTGTLTEGVFEVQETYAVNGDENSLIRAAACAESYSDHPVAASIRRAYGKEINRCEIGDVTETAGEGVTATVGDNKISAGNEKLMRSLGVDIIEPKNAGTAVHVAVNGEYAGYILISDKPKADSKAAIESLRRSGVKKIVMLTGDSKKAGESTAAQLGIDEVYTELLPEDKVKIVEKLISQNSKNASLIFTGDGINDAPVLARADVGIAMGGVGSQAAIEAADAVIMNDAPSKIAQAIAISKRTLGIAYQNIVFAISVKVIVLVLSALGITTMWAAVFADVGVAVLAILNAFRALKVKT